MTSSSPKVPWSHGDRLLFLVLGIVLIVAVSLFFRFHAQDEMPNITVPAPVMPTPNAYDFYVRAGNTVTGGGIISPSTPQPALPTPAQVAVIGQNAGAIGLLHQGFQYPYHGPVSRSFFSVSYSQDANLRGLARLLGLQARVNAARGDYAGAMTADLDCLRMGEDMPRGSGLMGMLVGVACKSIGRRHAWELVDHLSAAQARAAARRLEAVHASHVPYADTLQESEWATQASLLEVMGRPDWPGGISDWYASFSNNPSVTETVSDTLSNWKKVSAIRMTGKRAIMANYTSYMDQAIANARQPYAAHPPAPTPPSDPVNHFLIPANIDFRKIRLNEVSADTEDALLLTLLALRAYKLEHGVYPTALSALAPAYLKDVPADPFALSGPLHYKQTGSGFLLYSVGPDGKDDGGKPIFDAARPAPTNAGWLDSRYAIQPESQGDIVAGVNIY